MRLGEMLMLGSTMITPVRGRVSDGMGGGCAIGMMRRADREYQRWEESGVKYKFPDICKCFSHLVTEVDIICAIAHLFDAHVYWEGGSAPESGRDWTISQLADWLEEVEPKEAENAEVLPVQECGEPERSCVGSD